MRALTYFVLFAVHMSCIRHSKSVVFCEKVSVDNVVGAYQGELPCVDCKGINTILQLENDNSYTLTCVYEGKSKEEFVKEGVWKIDNNYLILKGIDFKYKIEDGHLVQLDLSGEEIKGELSEKYLLSRVK